MPGPSAWLGPTLAAAVRAAEIEESVVDGQVRHLLRLMSRVGILDGGAGAPRQPESEEDDPGRRAVARQVATEGTVLLVNDGLLPLDPAAMAATGSGSGGSVAVIGSNAGQLEVGGGSSEVTPHRRRRLADALAERLPGVDVRYEIGCRIHKALPNLDMRLLTDESLSLSYYDNVELSGAPLGSDVGHSARVLWVAHLSQLPAPTLPVATSSVRLTAEFTPDVSGLWTLGLESAGGAVWRLDGEVVLNNSEPTRGTGFYGAGSALITTEIELEAGRAYAVEVDLWSQRQTIPVLGVRLAADRPEPADEFERAVALAAASDVAVVVVGSNGSWESEGFDRPDLSLPGRQRDLVEAVIAVNPRTVVVVNAGSPVEMPWADTDNFTGSAANAPGAVLLPWYSGEEGADAIADILVGLSEPGGRLPVSLPKRIEDTSAFGHYPGADGQVTYGEGVFVGYRHPIVAATTHFPFGFGLSYTTFDYGEVDVEQSGGADVTVTVTVALTNTGTRLGSEVVQVYVHTDDDAIERPDRVLAAFAKVTLDPGATESVTLPLDPHAFAHWSDDWITDAGRYELLIGSSSQEVRQSAEVIIPASSR
jgi:beta-glucosidase